MRPIVGRRAGWERERCYRFINLELDTHTCMHRVESNGGIAGSSRLGIRWESGQGDKELVVLFHRSRSELSGTRMEGRGDDRRRQERGRRPGADRWRGGWMMEKERKRDGAGISIIRWVQWRQLKVRLKGRKMSLNKIFQYKSNPIKSRFLIKSLLYTPLFLSTTDIFSHRISFFPWHNSFPHSYRNEKLLF